MNGCGSPSILLTGNGGTQLVVDQPERKNEHEWRRSTIVFKTTEGNLKVHRIETGTR